VVPLAALSAAVPGLVGVASPSGTEAVENLAYLQQEYLQHPAVAQCWRSMFPDPEIFLAEKISSTAQLRSGHQRAKQQQVGIF
jgi:hypothetical protein